MDEVPPVGERPLETFAGQPFARGLQPIEPERSPTGSPTMGWPAWAAPAALFGGLLLSVLGGLVVDLPASALGVRITSEHTPPGITIADTVVQDIGFVLAAVYFAHLGGRPIAAWQFGLRRPEGGWRRAIGLIAVLLLLFIALNAIWSVLVNPEEETLLKQLGSKEGTVLLLLSAGLTCVIAPICEEFLFRGFIFTALRNWRGTLPAAVITGVIFGGVHAGSAPLLDLVPLALLGFGLCLLYRRSGSLYPCFAAHSLNNSIAFASLEGWGWQAPVLIVAALAAIAAVVAFGKSVGLITREPSVLLR
jgi:membrane protease YdiL (CAAX protease family)